MPALKAPTLRESASRLVERAGAASWSHEENLAACLQREVAARDAHGGEGRITAARFPARKSLEEFDFDQARGLKRDQVAHLGTLDFVAARDNVIFLGRRTREDPFGNPVGHPRLPSRPSGAVGHRQPMARPAR
ncbi:MAG TPA: ATP-binding protein [Propionibacteriaceae bacterium]|nr:ATP-binding protein [Propionibacteriaceae bacterium]